MTEVSPKYYPLVVPVFKPPYAEGLRQKIIPWFERSGPKSKKILAQSSVGNKSSDIGKGEAGSAFYKMMPFRVGLDTISI